MITWLHNFHPQAVLLSFGPISIYWYGLFMVAGILGALLVSFKLAKHYQIKSDTLFDLAFWLIIFGLLGARIYDIFLQLPYYISSPKAVFKIWEGGLAIHGAIIAGLITIYFFSKKHHLSLWRLTALFVPGLALGQAIGRWGNYFNQEIFGLPTSVSWGIPIDLLNRPWSYLSFNYFHPTFLYESLGCLVIFLILITTNLYLIRKQPLNNLNFVWMVSLYMLLYSILRFSLEFIRIDDAPYLFDLRWPQIMSLALILASISLIIFYPHAKKKAD